MKRQVYKLTHCAILVLMALLVCSPDADAASRKKTKKAKKGQTEQADTVKTRSKYEKLLGKPHKKAEGMITLHLVNGKVYFEMPVALFGREMLMGSTIKSISDNAHGLVGSKPDLRHISFEKRDSSVYLLAVNTDYMASDEHIGQSLPKNYAPAKVKALPVAAYNADSTAVVFNVTDLFLEHDKTMSPFAEVAAPYSDDLTYQRTESFKKDLSYIADIKAFEDNVSVTSSLSYTYTMTRRSDQWTLAKDRPFTAELTRSIILLPEKAYHPRMADYRIGVFFTERRQFGDNASASKPVYFANRWRLEPSDTAAFRRGELVEPVKPVVFYVDSDFPAWWKPYIKEAVEQWQKPFEAIGFKNAVIAKDFPAGDPSFDPDNIKYSCIRYAPVGVQNAMGPSWVDPRSGEIINASVYVYHDIMRLINRWLFVQTAQADPLVRSGKPSREVLGDALRYVIAHEVGHCLGFMHNMGASSTVPVESLRDPEYTTKYGTTPSIMDYARFNYVAQPGDKERGVKLTPPRFGPYDQWLVRWAYTPVFDAEDLAAEEQLTSGWITDSLAAAPYYRYGKQQLNYMFFDPRDQTEDLGDDVLKATAYGVSNLKYITSRFMDWVTEDEECELRTEIFNGILNQYLTYAQHVMLNVGGLYKNEVKSVDAAPRFANIPAARQKAALRYLFTLSEDLAWLGDKKVLDRLPVVGSPEYAVRSMIYDMILDLPFLASKSDGVVTKEFSAKECLDMIYDYVWAPTVSGKKLTAAQKLLQTKFVTGYMRSAGFKLPSEKSFVSEDVLPVAFGGSGCCIDAGQLVGDLVYSPVSGFDYVPRSIFNNGTLTSADLYVFLTKAETLMKRRLSGASAEDRSHYEILLQTIRYSLQ